MNANRKVWILPLIFSLMFALAMLLSFSQWSWSLFDEIGWMKWLYQGRTVLDFVTEDFANLGRIRPFSAIFAFGRYELLGFHPRFLRIERLAELILLLTLVYRWVRVREKTSILFTAFALAFILKSPPIIENFRCMTLSELGGTAFVLIALLLRKHSQLISYLFLILAALTKEPFIIFLALPALMDRKFREAAISGGITFCYLLFLFKIKKGGIYEIGITDSTKREVAKQVLIDFAPVLLLLVLTAKNLLRFPWKKKLSTQSKTWRALVILPFVAAYSLVVGSKASGYIYYFTPVVVFISIALAVFFEEIYESTKFSRLTTAFLALVVVILPLRFCWSSIKLYSIHKPKYELGKAIESAPKGLYGSNCVADLAGMGFAANRLEEYTGCAGDNANIAECCKHADLLGLLAECMNFDERTATVHQLGLPVLGEAKGWGLYKCR